MPNWIKFDENLPHHPKFSGLPVTAKWGYVESLCYASRFLTDGWIPEGMLRDIKVTGKDAILLVGAGLWEPSDGGFFIHDYLEYQRSRAQIREKKHTDSARKRNGFRADSTLQIDRSRKIEAEAERKPAAPADAQTRAYQAWDKQAPMGMNPAIKEKLDAELESGTPVEFIEKACQIAGEAGGRKPWNYVNSILSRLKAGKPDKKPAENTMGIYRLPKKASNS